MKLWAIRDIVQDLSWSTVIKTFKDVNSYYYLNMFDYCVGKSLFIKSSLV